MRLTLPTKLSLLLLVCTVSVRAQVRIDAAGADAALLENLRTRLALTAEPCDTPVWRLNRLYQQAEQDVQPALRAFGYYRSSISGQLRTEADCWVAEFAITLGPRVTIAERKVVLRGPAQQDAAFTRLLADLPLKIGEGLHHGRYEQIKSSLRDLASERGYFDFRFTHSELRVDPEQATAAIRIEADSGRRYRFGALRLSEQPLDEKFVRRLARISPGQPYDARELARLDRTLSDVGYFKTVQVSPRRDAARDERIPIDVSLTAKPRHAWRAGIGYATDTGPRLSAGYKNRYVNSRGLRFETELRLSPVESGFSADFIFPGSDPHHESYSLGTRLLSEDNDSANSDSLSILARQTIKNKRWTQIRFLELLHEKYTVGDDDTRATLLMPGISLERIKVDDPLRTRRGYRARLELRGAHDGLLSTASFLQLQANLKGIHRFGKAGRITGRLDAGITFADSVVDLPASLRFFAGGDNSVRGYAYKSLGPLDADGKPDGGLRLLTGSIEYEHPIVGEDWWLGAFIDSGNAFDGDSFRARTGYGLGLRWYSPVGRLRLDLAFPDDRSEDNWRLHFGLGADL